MFLAGRRHPARPAHDAAEIIVVSNPDSGVGGRDSEFEVGGGGGQELHLGCRAAGGREHDGVVVGEWSVSGVSRRRWQGA